MIIKKYLILFLGLVMFYGCNQTSSDIIRVAGVVDGDIITVKTMVNGKINTLNLKEGENISAGDILAEVDTKKLLNSRAGLTIGEKEIRVNRKKIEHNIKFLRSNRTYWSEQVTRFTRLRSSESVSGDDLKRAALKLEEVEAKLFEAEQSMSALDVKWENIQNQKQMIDLQLEDFVITSPVSGIILEKFVSGGETVFPGTAIADILDRDSLYIEAFLEEQELSLLQLGQKTKLYIDGRDDQIFTGIISYFGQKAEFSPKYIISEKERRSLLYRIKIRVEEDQEYFKLGMPLTIEIDKPLQ